VPERLGRPPEQPARGLRWAIAGVLIAGVLALLVLGANRPADPSLEDPGAGVAVTTITAADPTVPTVPTSPQSVGGSGGRQLLAGFGEIVAVVRGPDGTLRALCFLLAESDSQRQQGLMSVTDASLGGYEGMLFLYVDDVTFDFHMRNTPLPLSIAWLDSSGGIVSATDMEPCGDVTGCPLYAAEGPYRYAVEVVQGRLDDIGLTGSATLTPGAHSCAGL
jgi:uncharacterized membrane protein (UPF0127 family)